MFDKLKQGLNLLKKNQRVNQKIYERFKKKNPGKILAMGVIGVAAVPTAYFLYNYPLPTLVAGGGTFVAIRIMSRRFKAASIKVTRHSSWTDKAAAGMKATGYLLTIPLVVGGIVAATYTLYNHSPQTGESLGSSLREVFNFHSHTPSPQTIAPPDVPPSSSTITNLSSASNPVLPPSTTPATPAHQYLLVAADTDLHRGPSPTSTVLTTMFTGQTVEHMLGRDVNKAYPPARDMWYKVSVIKDTGGVTTTNIGYAPETSFRPTPPSQISPPSYRP